MTGLQANELPDLFLYDPLTGEVVWKKRFSNRIKADLRLGKNSKGYVSVYVKGRNYAAHRIAWAMHYGAFPDGPLDHINGDRADNRICNLRVVTTSENQKNTRLDRRNKSGVSGVRFRSDRQLWEASIRSDRKLIHLGRFRNFDDAVSIRRKAEVEYGFHANHGKEA